MQDTALTVKQLNFYVKSLLEGDSHLVSVLVTGEISNFKNHYSSGHLYFTLKDNDAAIKCVMFRANAQHLRFLPEDGQAVLLRGRVSLYEKDGQYQFYAEDMQAVGIGDYAAAFEQIKAKLEKEGLFNSFNKMKLPKYPRNIAVVTSSTGAAIKDITNVLGRRYPLCRVIICPVSVQGERAVPEMIDALEQIYMLGTADLIIIGRGGGSIEDLWAFNSELLARKIYESPIPVISAVGHENDYTICDFVADLRAPTPSAAAELAVPDMVDILSLLGSSIMRMDSALVTSYKINHARHNTCLASAYLRRPVETLVYRYELRADLLNQRLTQSTQKTVDDYDHTLKTLIAKLDALSPLKTISRGYVAIQKKGNSVNSVKDLEIDDHITVQFSDGKAMCRVLSTTNKEE